MVQQGKQHQLIEQPASKGDEVAPRAPALTLVHLAKGPPAQERPQLGQHGARGPGDAGTQQLRDAAHAVQVIAVGPGPNAQAAALAVPPCVLLGSLSPVKWKVPVDKPEESPVSEPYVVCHNQDAFSSALHARTTALPAPAACLFSGALVLASNQLNLVENTYVWCQHMCLKSLLVQTDLGNGVHTLNWSSSLCGVCPSCRA